MVTSLLEPIQTLNKVLVESVDFFLTFKLIHAKCWEYGYFHLDSGGSTASSDILQAVLHISNIISKSAFTCIYVTQIPTLMLHVSYIRGFSWQYRYSY